MPVKIKRIYEPAAETDGYRVLIDRLWPRGIKKEGAHIDKWLKEVAPSTALRNWFNHEPEKWPEFAKRYRSELAKRKDLLKEVKKLEREHGTVTLLYGRKDEKQNQAVLIAAALKGKK